MCGGGAVKKALLTVEVLSIPGCPSVAETLMMAGDVVSSMVPGSSVRDVRMTEAEAAERGFPGSPTVLVNGRDIAGFQPHAAGVS
jgi:hypothetical protein